MRSSVDRKGHTMEKNIVLNEKIYNLKKEGFVIIWSDEDEYCVTEGHTVLLAKERCFWLVRTSKFNKVTLIRDFIEAKKIKTYGEDQKLLPKHFGKMLIHGSVEFKEEVAKKLNGRYVSPGADRAPLCGASEEVLRAENCGGTCNNYLVVPQGTTEKKVEWAFYSSKKTFKEGLPPKEEDEEHKVLRWLNALPLERGRISYDKGLVVSDERWFVSFSKPHGSWGDHIGISIYQYHSTIGIWLPERGGKDYKIQTYNYDLKLESFVKKLSTMYRKREVTFEAGFYTSESRDPQIPLSEEEWEELVKTLSE